jgi:serine/threonine-protein phosphatase 6 catalytic subunit
MRTIERDQEIPHRGGFCDLMWSDPDDIDWWAISPRGAGWLFGEKPTSQFMHNNQLSLICRAHQLVQEGKHHLLMKYICPLSIEIPNTYSRCISYQMSWYCVN